MSVDYGRDVSLLLAVDCSLLYGQALLVVLDVFLETSYILGSGGDRYTCIASEYNILEVVSEILTILVNQVGSQQGNTPSATSPAVSITEMGELRAAASMR